MKKDFMIKLKALAEDQNLSLREVALRSCYRYYQKQGYSIEILEDELANLPDPDLFEIYEGVYRSDQSKEIVLSQTFNSNTYNLLVLIQ